MNLSNFNTNSGGGSLTQQNVILRCKPAVPGTNRDVPAVLAMGRDRAATRPAIRSIERDIFLQGRPLDDFRGLWVRPVSW